MSQSPSPGAAAKKAVVLLALVVLFFLAAGGTFLLWFRAYAERPGPQPPELPVVLTIPAGSGFAAIEELLVSSGIIEKDIRFRILARVDGTAHRLQAGDYLFQGRQTPEEVLRILASGRVMRIGLTIPEGSTAHQIADLLAGGGFAGRDEFLAMTRDPAIIKELGVAAPSLEGYLFPDTYFLARGQTGLGIVKMMVSRLRTVLAELNFAEKEGAGMSLHEVLTLASIVEKETGVPEERSVIASVFLNRLKKGMLLQTDPTVIYGLSNFTGNLTRQDLITPTPYNTYVNPGLPPGPIANPGKAAIAAVLNPSGEPYLYFVSKNDGSHHFSRTLDEHNRAVNLYQRKRK